ncbi:MAG: hypothetical protein GKS07_06790 [Nitrosopumilus sp.]|nr:MAG: hypothetical protein GKS07_06790 [Nitrosopumilus sp.]
MIQSNMIDHDMMFSNKEKIKCPYCGILRQFEEFDTREFLKRHALAEHGLKLP